MGSNPTPSAILILTNVQILIDAKLEALFFMENKLDRPSGNTRRGVEKRNHKGGFLPRLEESIKKTGKAAWKELFQIEQQPGVCSQKSLLSMPVAMT
ncbi:MAG: hypothetical protein DME66_11130 [Verrucomicrobia bacterium]|nr:MAG: hypothetical protein DME66_11130 [Verrucomicrobiota bacterium]